MEIIDDKGLTNEAKPRQIRAKPTGRPPRHGGFSLMVRTGELPENRRYLREYLTSVRRGLIADLGPEEKDLSAAELVLVDRVISKLGVLRCIEEHVRETGVLRGELLAPSLAKYWLPISNSLRQDLLALGVERRDVEDRLNLGRYLELQAQDGRQPTEERVNIARECPRGNDLGVDDENHGKKK